MIDERLGIINAVIEANVLHASRDGWHGWQNEAVVIGRDPNRKRVLLGGMGAFGCGMMWVDEEERHTKLKGWDGAPTMFPKDPDPPPTTPIVHVLFAGVALCHKLQGVPSEWPAGHKWVSFQDPEVTDRATCPECTNNLWTSFRMKKGRP